MYVEGDVVQFKASVRFIESLRLLQLLVWDCLQLLVIMKLTRKYAPFHLHFKWIKQKEFHIRATIELPIDHWIRFNNAFANFSLISNLM